MIDSEKISDKAVEELESLKTAIKEPGQEVATGDVVSVSKSQSSSFSNVDGNKVGQKEMINEIDKNGKTFLKVLQKVDVLKNKGEEPKTAVQTEIDVPSKGIHQVIKNDKNLETTNEKNEPEVKRTVNGGVRMNIFPKINYGPRDMANYIFWTGDEKSVTLTVEEFLREGLMSRQEAINFLQSIKHNLDLMQFQYQGQGKPEEKISKGISNLKLYSLPKDDFVEKPREYVIEEQLDTTKLQPSNFLSENSDLSELKAPDSGIKENPYLNKLSFANDDSNGFDYIEKKNESYNKLPTDGSESDDGYDDIMERLRVANLLKKEYSLEEVIFELSKLMFSESLKNGNTAAQKAMEKFSTYLQNQVDNGQISVVLQKKILEVLMSALMDALAEHPELINRPVDDLKMIFDSPTSSALKQLLTFGTSSLTGQSDGKEKLSEKALLLRNQKLSKELL